MLRAMDTALETHRTRTLAARPMPRWPWMRDFALVGATTGFLAPYAVLRKLEYAACAGLGGAIFGLALGAFSAHLLAGRARRWRKVVFVPLGLVLGGLWGAVAGASAAVVLPMALDLSVVVAGIAGALQLGWFWLAYSVRRVNGRSTWLVLLLALLSGGGLGWAAVGTFFTFTFFGLFGR